jgi:hypothetical protein
VPETPVPVGQLICPAGRSARRPLQEPLKRKGAKRKIRRHNLKSGGNLF